MSEFDLIRRHFTRPAPGVLLGVGDDAALMQVRPDRVLAVSSDMLVSGTHFFADADPYLLGHKTLAVNLSDMAAMGAQPRWATLAIALPAVDDAWLARFSEGFFSLAGKHGVHLVGGDTTRGPLNLCVTIFGEVAANDALRRSGAQEGDEIWVSGRLGDAALALAHLQGEISLSAADYAACAAALHQPQPRVALGLALCGVASAAIDISDGLTGDLAHILAASGVAARIKCALLPVSEVLKKAASVYGPELFLRCALSGGDDYELCFTAPAKHHAALLNLSVGLDLTLTCIGKIVAGQGCVVLDADSKPVICKRAGYDHF